MKPHLKLITFLSLASTSLAFSQAIVYQDTFDEDGLDTGTGSDAKGGSNCLFEKRSSE